MTKVIVINNCLGCPNKDHKGGFGAISYIPVCRIGSPTGRARELPYEVGLSYDKMVTAGVKPGIPDWCPLEDR